MLSSGARQINELLDLVHRMLNNGHQPPLAEQVGFFEKKRDVFELLASQTVPGTHRDEAAAAAAEAAEQVRALRRRLETENP